MRWLLSFSIGLLAVQNAPTLFSIQGVVTNESGAPVPGASVELAASALTRDTATSAAGRFVFTGLRAGRYEVTVRLPGFATTTRTVVLRTTDVTLRLQLRVSTVEEALMVTTSAPLVGAKHLTPGSGWLSPPVDREAYDHIEESSFREPEGHPLSTFSIDVDTASYANVRRFIENTALPPRDAVRIEELVNYFRFAYPEPRAGKPLSITTELGACPWQPGHRLALVGLKAPSLRIDEVPPRALVFLIDVSGSMASADKLPLLKSALALLVETLRPEDRVAIVVYAGASGLALPTTPGDRKLEILRSLDQLDAGGATNGAEGIQLAYAVAQQQFQAEGVNRVVLATDGDFNVGITDRGSLQRLIERKRNSGVFLSVLGFGTGNLQDATMEQLADNGDGNYAYVDSLREARKALVTESGGTLVTVAKDVKIQVEFNPTTVAAYRLIGYEDRALADADFSDDDKDAGELGTGHTVTALYEVVPRDVPTPTLPPAPLRYQTKRDLTERAGTEELMFVSVRFKTPTGSRSQVLTRRVERGPVSEGLSDHLGFAAAVVEFGMSLRDSRYKGLATLDEARLLALRHLGSDPHGYRAEFVTLVERASEVWQRQRGSGLR